MSCQEAAKPAGQIECNNEHSIVSRLQLADERELPVKASDGTGAKGKHVN